jgi:hypothetical protein
MAEEKQVRAWWQTVPGMLTGIAAVLTATTGLMVALNQTGWLKRTDAAARGHPSDSMATSAKAAGEPAGTLAPSMVEVKLGDAVFTLLRMQHQPRTPDTHTLTLRARLTNQGPYPVNFWNANFRLLADGVPHAPVGDLNKVVEGSSAQDGDVEFSFPASARSLVLRISAGQESTDIRLRWTSAQ